MSHNPHDLFAALGLAPALPGARCRGRPHMFDEQQTDEDIEAAAQRHAQALSLCRDCPALASCSAWFDDLPRSKRPTGVVAGQLHRPNAVGRPRKNTPAQPSTEGEQPA